MTDSFSGWGSGEPNNFHGNDYVGQLLFGHGFGSYVQQLASVRPVSFRVANFVFRHAAQTWPTNGC